MRRLATIAAVDMELDIAINEQLHDAYAAAARVRWPEALLQLRQCLECCDKASGEILRRHKALTAGDELAQNIDQFVLAVVNGQPTGPTAKLVIEALVRYKAARGLP